MATNGDMVGEIENSFLSCSICFQPFNSPKALPCLHTFCEGCLRDFVHSRFEGSSQFPCPICRQVIPFPSNGVAGFPNNHFLLNLRDTIEAADGSYSSPGSGVNSEGQSLLNVSKGSSVVAYNGSAEQRIAKLSRRFGHFGVEALDLSRISGLAISILTDDIVLADCSLNKISVYSADGIFRHSFLCDCSIRDVAVSRSGTILVTVSRSHSAILREYGFDGRLVGSYGSHYTYENPFGVAISSRDKVIITGLQQNCINVLTDRKNPSIRFGSSGNGPNHFYLPYYVATNSRDDIIVSDTGNHRVKLHKNDGYFEFDFGHEGGKDGEFFYPMGVCVDHYDNIYVADANNHRVQMFSPDGEFLACPVRNTYEYGMDVKPTNVAFLHRDKLVVALRGMKFAEIHVYEWKPSRYGLSSSRNMRKRSGKQSSFATLCTCCIQSSPYDDI